MSTTTETKSTATNESTGAATRTDVGSAGSSAAAAVRNEVRAVGYEAGNSRVRPAPAGESIVAGGVEVPRGAPMPTADPTRDAAFRKSTLDWAKGRIDRVNSLMSYGAFDWAVTNGEASEALEMLEQIPTPNRIVVVNQLGTGKALSRLKENMPDKAKQASPAATLTIGSVTGDTKLIREILRRAPVFMNPSQDIQLLYRAMSTVTDDVVREQADAQVHNPAAAHFPEWLAMTPEPPQADLARRFGEQTQAIKQGDAAKQVRDEHEKALNLETNVAMTDQVFASQVNSIEDMLSYSLVDWAITDGEARRVFGIFCALHDKSPHQVELAAFRLDQKGPFMDRFLDNLAPADRWGEHKRAFLRIISARRPERNVAFIKELLTTGVFHWSPSSDEAALAFALVKTMPKDVQDSFRAEKEGEWWAAMEKSLDQRDANNKDANVYKNDEEAQKRMLDFAEQATKWEPAQLAIEVEMLCRMGKDDFVEKTLQDLKLDADPKFESIYEKYGFARAGGKRDEKKYAAWRDNAGSDRKDRDTWEAVKTGLGLAGTAIGAGVTGKADTELDLEAIQNLAGGDLGGMVLDPRTHGDANRVHVGLDTGEGKFSLSGKQLLINSISTFSEGTSLQTGPVSLNGVDIAMKWPTEKDPSSYFKLSIPNMVAKDIWQTTGKTISTVGDMCVNGLEIEARRPAGPIPKDKSAGIAQMITEAKDTVARLLSMLKGTNPQPDQLALALGTTMSSLQADVKILSVEARNVATSDGGFVGGVKVVGLKANLTNRRKGDVIRERLAALTSQAAANPLTAAEQAEKTELEGKLTALAPLEAREKELATKGANFEPNGLIGGLMDAENKLDGLSPAERDELGRIRSELTITEATLDVASVAVHDVAMGGTKAKDVSMTALHAQVTAAPTSGDGKTAGVTAQSDATAKFSVGTMETNGLVSRGKNQLEEFEARVAQLQTRIKDGISSPDEQQRERVLSAQVADVHAMIAVADRMKVDPAAGANLTEDEKGLLYRAEKELPEWLNRQPDTTVDHLALTNELSKPAMSGSVNMRTGQSQVDVANMAMTGYQSGGQRIESQAAKNVSLGLQSKGDLRTSGKSGPETTFLDQLTSAKFEAEHLEMKGYHDVGKGLSATLEKERVTLEKALTLGQPMSLAQKERLVALPEIITQAKASEARLGELRAKSAASQTLTHQERAELDVLAAKCDPKLKHIDSLEANHVERSLSGDNGFSMHLGKEGAAEKGLSISGYRAGNVGPDGQENISQSVDSLSAQTLDMSAKTNGGLAGLADSANLASGKRDLTFGMSGTGLDIGGYASGQKGKAGYQHVDSVTAQKFDMAYDRQQNGGTGALSLEGAEIKGVTRTAGKLDALDRAIATYTTKEQSGVALTTEQQAHLTELVSQRRDYEALQEKFAKAKTTSQKKAAQSKLDAWEKTTGMRIERIATTQLGVSATGLGNTLDENWNMDDQKLGIAMQSKKMSISGVSQTDTRGKSSTMLKSADITGMNVSGTNVLGAAGASSSIHADIDGIKARGVNMGSAYASSANITGLSADMRSSVTPDKKDPSKVARHTDVTGRAKGITAGGVSASGTKVASAGLGGVRFGVSNMGEQNQVANVSSQSITAGGIKYQDGAKSAGVDKVNGSGLTLSTSAAGMSGGLRTADVRGANFHSMDEQGGMLDAGASSIGATGVTFATQGKSVKGGAKTATIKDGYYEQDVMTPNMSGSLAGHRSGAADQITATGVGGSYDGGTGAFSGGAATASVKGGRFKETDAAGQVTREATVDRLSATGLSAEGNAKAGTVDAKFGTIVGERLFFSDVSDPTKVTQAISQYFKVGSSDELSVLSWDGMTLNGKVKGLDVRDTSATFGGTSMVDIQGALTAGLINFRDFNPKDLTQAGSSVQLANVHADHLVYNDSKRLLVVKKGDVKNIFMEGLGDGHMAAGVVGVNAADLSYSEKDEHGVSKEMLAGKDLYITGAYATMQQGVGQDWSLVQARVLEIGGKEIKVNVFVDKSGPSAAHTYDPAKEQVNLDALKHVNGYLDAKVSIPVAGDLKIKIPVKDGKIRVADVVLELRGLGLTGKDLSRAVGRVLGSALPPGMAPITGELAAYASEYPIDVQKTLEGSLNKSSDASTGPGTVQKNLDSVEINGHFENLQGTLGYGDAFTGQVQKGTSVDMKGNVGNDLNIDVNGLGMTDVKAAGGDASISQINADNAHVRIQNLKTGKMEIEAVVKGGKVVDVTYGNQSNPKTADADKAYQRAAQ